MKSAIAPLRDTPAMPRRLDAAASFAGLVGWLQELAVQRNAPGFVVGISGTDSLLAFLACARAMAALGKGDRVLGIHYGAVFPPADKSAEEVARIVGINPSYRWVARSIVPWLQAQAPEARVVTDDSIDYTDDHARWAALFRASLHGVLRTEQLGEGQGYWVVGTRNATEQALGTYSNLSGAASLQPLVHLWKSEVLQLCSTLNVPQLAIDKSRQVDCDCGRYDLAADHIDEVDAILMVRAGQLDQHWLHENMPAELLTKLQAFVEQQIAYAAFKREIPYMPAPDVVCA